MTPPVDPARYAAYLGVMAVMVAAPGPANLFSIANGARRGHAAVVLGMLGMNTASLVWIGGAALGLAALATTMPLAFRLLAWGGAAYVAWLGLQSLLSARHPDAPLAHGLKLGGRSAFADGFAVQISNPKAMLFITAVLPPFIDASRPLPGQLAVFGGTLIAMDAVSMTAYGFGGAALARRMNEPHFRRGFAIFTGVLLIAAAALIALRG
ncbi:LysE family translocator [Phenylobacterium deserti]|uniref:LysE family translocator n=1 Tax=Phenylobacterium deserti TaxID=1914756 RepID=A0A328AUI6_9CAUL|nr:LysE family translocator [Phenylobacterium deserti]RAK57356.1 LysE family translocator [Phenylobacterium deserti]